MEENNEDKQMEDDRNYGGSKNVVFIRIATDVSKTVIPTHQTSATDNIIVVKFHV